MRNEMQKRTLEINCYVLGAGAFGVFFRWLQNMMAFNDEGLADASVFHVLVPLYLLVVAAFFLRFVDKARQRRFYLPDRFADALHHEGKLFTAARYGAGAILFLGGLVLFATCEVEKEASMLRILALLAMLSGVSYPFLLSQANQARPHIRLSCLCALAPVLMFSFWLITCYKINSINSVVWAYVMEIIAVVVALLAFFRIAGFPFGCPNPWRCIFFAMVGTGVCIMALADSRNFGMQLMFLGSACMLLLYNWIMIHNMQRKEAPPRVQPDDGFERL